MPKFYIIIARKKIFPGFFFGGGARAPLPSPSHTHMPVLLSEITRKKDKPTENEQLLLLQVLLHNITGDLPNVLSSILISK